MFLEMKDIKFYYNKNEVNILDQFNLAIKNGKTLSILGESGSGKSTILRLIAGLEKPSKGEIFIDYKNTTFCIVSPQFSFQFRTKLVKTYLRIG